MGYLLTLDLASNIGFTRGRVDDRYFEIGSHRLPKTDDLGHFASAYRYWLHGQLEGVDTCVFEAPIMPKLTSLMTCRRLYGLAWQTQLCCRDFGASCNEVSPMKIKAFMGSGSYRKADMIRAVQRYGYDPRNDDEADATALRLYMIHKLLPHDLERFKLDLGALSAATT